MISGTPDTDSIGRSLYDIDPSAAAFGIELLDVADGRAVTRMTVTRAMCNGFDMCHGGMTFLLADSAMAFASNNYDNRALATQASIDWLAPVPLGAVMTATATQRWHRGKTRLYDIVVTIADPDGDGADIEVALVHGRTQHIGGAVAPADAGGGTDSAG